MSDDIDEEDFPDVLIDMEFEVSIIRFVGDRMIPSKLKIKSEVLPSVSSSDQELETAFAKIKFWISNILSKCIVFSVKNTTAIAMLVDVDNRNIGGNILMVTPENPTDDHIAALLQSKMTALSSGALEFGGVEVKSDNEIGLTFTYIGVASETLPIMQDWIGERSYFDFPWWCRDDASTLDVTPSETADLNEKPAWAFSLDFIEKSIRPQNNTETLLRPKFTPTIHDGGKK